MKYKFSIPIMVKSQNALIQEIRDVFGVEAKIVERATDVEFEGVSFSDLDKFSQLTFPDIVSTTPMHQPFAQFIFITDGPLLPEQQAFLDAHKDIQMETQYSMEEGIAGALEDELDE